MEQVRSESEENGFNHFLGFETLQTIVKEEVVMIQEDPLALDDEEQVTIVVKEVKEIKKEVIKQEEEDREVIIAEEEEIAEQVMKQEEEDREVIMAEEEEIAAEGGAEVQLQSVKKQANLANLENKLQPARKRANPEIIESSTNQLQQRPVRKARKRINMKEGKEEEEELEQFHNCYYHLQLTPVQESKYCSCITCRVTICNQWLQTKLQRKVGTKIYLTDIKLRYERYCQKNKQMPLCSRVMAQYLGKLYPFLLVSSKGRKGRRGYSKGYVNLDFVNDDDVKQKKNSDYDNDNENATAAASIQKEKNSDSDGDDNDNENATAAASIQKENYQDQEENQDGDNNGGNDSVNSDCILLQKIISGVIVDGNSDNTNCLKIANMLRTVVSSKIKDVHQTFVKSLECKEDKHCTVMCQMFHNIRSHIKFHINQENFLKCNVLPEYKMFLKEHVSKCNDSNCSMSLCKTLTETSSWPFSSRHMVMLPPSSLTSPLSRLSPPPPPPPPPLAPLFSPSPSSNPFLSLQSPLLQSFLPQSFLSLLPSSPLLLSSPPPPSSLSMPPPSSLLPLRQLKTSQSSSSPPDHEQQKTLLALLEPIIHKKSIVIVMPVNSDATINLKNNSSITVSSHLPHQGGEEEMYIIIPEEK